MRALSVSDLLNKKYDLMPFDGAWYDAFKQPERAGVWFIWGNSGNGKTSFLLQLMKYLSRFGHVVFNSLEESDSHTMQCGMEREGMSEAGGLITIVKESPEELAIRLRKKKSAPVVIIDSYQYFGLTYRQYLEFKEVNRNRLIIFTSHASGRNPSSRSAVSVMFDATLKIWVEGYRAFSKGRYIGPEGFYTIWSEGAERYWTEVN
ncbi:MAG: hypothetical protein LBL04_14070 [Bacteroidales bacterium]|jgi:hypothetical protein|nr:hypothetical protein [Bacteroidales bacterium]